MTETIEAIPSKVTDDYWVYAFDSSETESDQEDEENCFEKSATADERQPNSLEHRQSKTDEPKVHNGSEISNGTSPTETGDAALDAVVEDLEKLGQTEEVVTYTGKWMLFFDQVEEDAQGHTAHDRAWRKIAPLCWNGQLWQAKASTALKDPKAHTQHLGCICCYTRDYRDQEDVRRKADLIRSSLEEELGDKFIYYKTDSATKANQYRVLGSGRVSIYRQKPDYSFWKTSEDKMSWDILYSSRRKTYNFRSCRGGGRIAPRPR